MLCLCLWGRVAVARHYTAGNTLWLCLYLRLCRSCLRLCLCLCPDSVSVCVCARYQTCPFVYARARTHACKHPLVRTHMLSYKLYFCTCTVAIAWQNTTSPTPCVRVQVCACLSEVYPHITIHILMSRAHAHITDCLGEVHSHITVHILIPLYVFSHHCTV